MAGYVKRREESKEWILLPDFVAWQAVTGGPPVHERPFFNSVFRGIMLSNKKGDAFV